jgi:hypothetical protein
MGEKNPVAWLRFLPASDLRLFVEEYGQSQDGRRRRGSPPDGGRGPVPARPTTSLAGSSTATTTARASSSATPTSPAPTTRTQFRRALRADVDEDAWASLYSTVSRPFPVPETGKLAVKVINHYGDEVLQVYDVDAD